MARDSAKTALASDPLALRPSTIARSAPCPRSLPARRAQHRLSARIHPAHPHTPALDPSLGASQPEIGPRARPFARPRPCAHWATHSMPSYPRHRASHFRSHMSTTPMRMHGGCDALPSVSRLSSPHSHQTFAFPLSAPIQTTRVRAHGLSAGPRYGRIPRDERLRC